KLLQAMRTRGNEAASAAHDKPPEKTPSPYRGLSLFTGESERHSTRNQKLKYRSNCSPPYEGGVPSTLGEGVSRTARHGPFARVRSAAPLQFSLSVAVNSLRSRTDSMGDVTKHPAARAPDALLAECEVRRTRRSGPGGQNRNKVETAVVLRHLP